MTAPATPRLALSAQKRAVLEALLRREGAAPAPAPDPRPAIPPRQEGAPIPLSFAQQRLWFLDQLEPGSGAYNLPAAVRLTGPLDVAVLARSLNAVVARHEALRTTFAAAEGRPAQVVAPALAVPLPVEDLAALPPAARGAAVFARARDEAGAPFDLAAGPLLRAALLRLGPAEHVLLLTLHHIVADGWSMGVFIQELGALCDAFSRGETPALPALPVQYGDYAAWQRGWLQGEALEGQLRYWREALAGLPEALDLPTDHPRPAVPSSRGATARAVFPLELTAALKRLAEGEGATLFMVLLGAYQALLGRYSGQADLAVGAPVANRARPELAGLIGFFANTLVLRADLSGAPTAREHLARVREACLGAYAHQDAPFERLVEELRPVRDAGRNPLVQAVFTLDGSSHEPLRFGHVEATLLDVHGATAKFDLLLECSERPDGLHATIEYSTDLFEQETAERLLGHLRVLLEGMAADPDARLDDLPLLPPAERTQLLTAWGTNHVPYPAQATVHDLFAAQAGRTPHAVALSGDGDPLTYGELDARANRLAHHLQALGVGPETRVGLCLDRSAGAVVAILGVLKAGGAYVPLDPAYPAPRLAEMLADAGVEVLLTESRLAGRLPDTGARVLLLDTPALQEALATRPASAPHSGAGPDHLAYVMYTSGSTGRPKGVAVTHRGVVRLVKGADYARLGPEEVFLQFAPLSFDASTLELWGPLLNGGRLALLPAGEMPSLADLGRAIRAHGVTTLWLTAGLFHQMVESQLEDLQGLRQLLAGGDVLSVPHVRRVLEGLPECRLINGYGPTECTTFTTCFPITPEATLVPSVPIGRPIANTEVYVLDRRRRLVPAGVPGELYVGGPGLARGYLGRPGLSAGRFVPHPFTPGARLYRTGDRARWLPQGALEFLGRLDQQVKIRGFRIEPGEVEAALAAHPEVGAAAVVVRGDGPGGEKRLVAYVTPRDGAPSGLPDGTPAATPQASALRAYLRERLPAYLIPGAFVVLEALPLNLNGKVDRKALPAPPPPGTEDGAPSDDEEAVAPRTAEETAIAAIWAELLGVPRVGVEADFFALGGHSLLATQVVARVRAALGVELPLRALFEAPTVAGLAALAARAAGAGGAAGEAPPASSPPPVLPVPRDGSPIPLSFAQQRLWFLDQLEPGSGAYNLPAAVRLTGPLDPVALQGALNALVARHEALRTTFAAHEGRPRQAVAPHLAVPLPVEDLAALPPAAREAAVLARAREEAGAPFDLGAGPLLRAALLRLDSAAHVLLLTLHHIVADGWSMGVLLGDLSALYAARARGAAPALPALPVQYGDYAAWQRGWLRGEALEGQLRYWRQALAGLPPLDLPADRPRLPVRSSNGAVVTALIPPPLVTSLKKLAEGEGATLFMVLLGAYQALLGRYSGQADLAVGAPVANRARPELAGLIGFFANTLVLRADLSGAPTAREHLARVREACLGAYAHQDAPFERLVDELQPQRDPSRTPLVQAAFSLQHALPAGPDFGGLTLEPLPEGGTTAKFDLTLALEETPAGLRAVAEYSTDLFERETIERLLGHYQALLEGFASSPETGLDDLPLLSDGEEQRLLRHWNATTRPYPHQRCVHHLVAERAALTPQALAVAGPTGSLTYGELDARANRLAHHLSSLGVGPETRVGVCLRRSPELVVAFLAVLKAGGAYVPLDPAYPPERLAGMLEDAGAQAVLTTSEAADGLPSGAARLVRLDDPAEAEAIAARPATAPPISGATTADHLAYVIYTSGSTGRPKGVQVPHAGLTNLVFWHQRAFGLTPEDRATQVASPAFDAATWEIWPYLACGASVHVPDEDTRAAPEALRDWLVAQGITVSFLPTPLAEAVMALDWPAVATLRLLLTGGDALRRPPPARLPFDLINNYGPTEYSVVTTSGYVPPVGADEPHLRADQPPGIGRPIANTEVYVLDRRRRLVPAGVPGELYVGGPGLARGYLGRPGLSAGRFVPHPFTPGARLYRTGDRARWLPQGALEFLGRLDQQVKIRGFRIEPGEVEATLATHPRVREVVVVAQDRPGGADKRLVAYVVLQPEGSAPEAADALAAEDRHQALPALRAYLQQRLPAYMVPAAFVTLDALPLTPNGKLDRKALPAPEAVGAGADGHGDEETDGAPAPVAPRTAAEATLAGIWAEVLGLPLARVGVEDNFFALGGDSILSIQVVARATRTGLRLTPRQLFQHQTIAELATVAGTAPAVQAEQEALTGPLPLTPIQRWFFEQSLPAPQHWNQAHAAIAPRPLRPDLLRAAVGHLLEHHDALRLRFRRTPEGDWEQEYAPPGATPDEIPVRAVDLSALSAERQEAALRALAGEAQASLDLEHGPLLRVVHCILGGGRGEGKEAGWPGGGQPERLLIAIHHLVVDAVSWPILLEDLQDAYHQLEQGQTPRLAPKTTSFRTWARRLAEYAATETVQAERDYWTSQPWETVRPLPVDAPGGGENVLAPETNVEGAAQAVVASLTPEETQALLQDAPGTYRARVEDLLLTALAQAFAAWTGERALLVDLEGHGREPLFEEVDLSRTVGWFTALYPVLLALDAPPGTPAGGLKAIKEHVRRVPGKGLGYGLLRYLDPARAGALEALPRPEVSFNYLGRVEQPVAAQPVAAQPGTGLVSQSEGAPPTLLVPIAGDCGPLYDPRAPRRHLLDVVCDVSDGRLQLRWIYSPAAHRRETVQGLADGFLGALRALLAPDPEAPAAGFTPSDFPRARLDQTQLDSFLAGLGRAAKR